MIKVIVVDDERFVRMGIVGETDWESLGCEVVGEAANGLEALDLVHEKDPDLMICDIRMPKMNGLEMLKKLREEGNPIQVIFLTAYSEFSYAREALKLYAFDYLLKPFEDGELEDAILRAKERIETERAERRPAVSVSGKVENSAGVLNPVGQSAEMDGKSGSGSGYGSGRANSAADKSAGTGGQAADAPGFRILLPFDENTAGLTGYVRDAVLYAVAHYGENSVNVAKIANAVGISEGHLSHCFKKETGYTVMGWLTRYRMKKAAELLADHRNKVYEVAEMVGYKDIAYFSNTFKKIAGVAPSEVQGK